MKKTIVVVGAGKGLGNHVAKRFGQEDFRVVLIARNGQALKEYREEFTTAGIETYVQTADAAEPTTLTAALDWVKRDLGTPDILFYNVGITAPDKLGETDCNTLIQHYQVDVASAYHCVQQVATKEFGTKKGTILITGGGLATHPMPEYTPLSLDKAALRAMTAILHKELAPQGIFVGTLLVQGAISIDPKYNPQLLAEMYWKIYTERREWEVIY